jgi:hypothetical protein
MNDEIINNYHKGSLVDKILLLSSLVLFVISVTLYAMSAVIPSNLIHPDDYQNSVNYIELVLIVMRILFSIINTKIRSSKSSCLKFSLIPFGVFVAITSFDKHIVTFLDEFIKLENMDFKPYMNNSLYFDFRIVVALMVLIYFTGLLFKKVNSLEFEQEISQRTSIIEKLFAFILIMTVLLPSLQYVFNLYTGFGGVTDFFNDLLKGDFMFYLTIVEIVGVLGLITIEVVNTLKVRKLKKQEKKVIA